MAPQHHDKLVQAETDKQAWGNLATIHAAMSVTRRMELRKQYSILSKEPPESLTRYTAGGMPLRNQLAAIGMQISRDGILATSIS